MQFLRMDFKEAVACLLVTNVPMHQSAPSLPKPSGELQLPDKAPNNRRPSWDLIHVRSINSVIVSCLMHEKRCSSRTKPENASLSDTIRKEHLNIVTAWNMAGSPFQTRSTIFRQKLSFPIVGASQKVYVFESPIDI